ncbi:MAG: phosphate signaling complex protein PhoU [Gammaproteobacteria bacterium]|jgi:phosphate transport system protein|nr:phosphate signaling complex protein PhoU [Gammaproteobacteria bacterium]MBT6041866.1 phosphate signaling complex protein PhoU [Gammaproteobacteria bacterium]
MSLHLQRDVEKLKKEILKLGTMVETAINNSILALNNREMSYVDEVLKNEEFINEMEVKIEEDCLKILALHQPVAGDLRFIVVALKVNNDLERMGDFAKNIAKRAKELMQVEPLATLPAFVNELPDLVRTMVRNSLDALVKLDVELAQEVIDMDDKVDEINRAMYDEVTRVARENPDRTKVAISLLSTSRYMERIGDLSTNIAEDVIFMVDGRVVRHAD